MIQSRFIHLTLASSTILFLMGAAGAQGFGPMDVITNGALQARSVYSADLDGDGDVDVLQGGFETLSWSANLGGGMFGLDQVILSQGNIQIESIQAVDLDGDGDLDVLTGFHDLLGGSVGLDQVVWHENLGGGSFGPKQVITTAADTPKSVYATDLDGDGDQDVLSASSSDGKIAWYENLGSGAFGAQQVITANPGAESVYATDLDGDGDADVLYTAREKIAWVENLAGGMFGPSQDIDFMPIGREGVCVYASDLDSDGDSDVLAATRGQGPYVDTISWYENLGSGLFGAEQVISSNVMGPSSVYATDLDGDGDSDVLSASQNDDKIAWYENDGTATPGFLAHIVSIAPDGPQSVYAADLDGDGDADVLSASKDDNAIAWYENQMGDCNGNGTYDPWDIANRSVLDCNGNSAIDSCEIASDPSLDLDLNGILDSCEVSGPYWFQSPVNFHSITVLPPTTWGTARSQATSLGGTLLTIRSSAENSWIQGVLPTERSWIGYHDATVEGTFMWHSQETPGYENWAPGAPGAFAADQDFVAINPITGTWDTWFSTTTFRAVVESDTVDCDGNQVADDVQIQNDPSLDCDSNGLIDACEITLNPGLDCNVNGTLDACEVLDSALDMNGDGLLDACIPPTYCTGAPNSSGAGGSIMALGSPELGLNNLTLQATQLPAFQWSYFLMSRNTTNVPNFGGSQGVLCLGAPIERLNISGTGQIDQTSASGERIYTLDFNVLPQGIVFQPGETWNFQLWFRDVNPSLTSNTTNGVTVMFR